MTLTLYNDNVLIASNPSKLAETAAELIVKAFEDMLKNQANVVFIPSSGRTPILTYQRLAQVHADTLDWSRIRLVQMDEYCGNSLPENKYFRHFLEETLVKPLGLEAPLFLRESGRADVYTPDAYDEKLRCLGPIDFALHGIGRNGHIGFNEPGSALDSKTRYVELAEDTRRDNFPNMHPVERPSKAITLGLSTLRNVKHTILLATDLVKAPSVRQLISKVDVSRIPACSLWTSPDFGILLDKDAASQLAV